MRKNKIKFLIPVLFLLFTWTINVYADEPWIPKSEKGFYVYDPDSIITKESRKYILDTNKEIQSKTGAQVVVVVVKSTGDKEVEDYSLGIFRNWKIGDNKKNNGILLLVSLQERKTRIEVGYGLEGAIPDIEAGRIQKEIIIPLIKEGKYDEGILNGFKEITGKISKEYNLDIRVHGEDGKTPDNKILTKLGIVGIVILAIIVIILDQILLGGVLRGFIIPWVLELVTGEDHDDYGGGGSAGGGGATEGW